MICGLGQYEAAFRENDIPAGVLADLTAEDLIGLGIASIGHRRKLLGGHCYTAGRRGSKRGCPYGDIYYPFEFIPSDLRRNVAKSRSCLSTLLTRQRWVRRLILRR